MMLSMNINNNAKYLVHDEWTDKLEKTFGGSKEKIEKLNEIRKVEYNNIPIVSKTGDYKNDPWSEAGRLSQKLINIYSYENVKGAFCKKVGEGDCEIDSFCKIAEYLNESKVKKAIIVDPYFSIKAMEKFLVRIQNINLNLEVITSLNDADPDKGANNANYLNEVKEFLKKNVTIIHQSLRIINISQNKNTAIHDRYLLRLFDNGTIDGYLLSNSLNSAGQNYSFVIAPMDKEVTYSVLEYVNELKDEEIQKKKSKSERLQIEILWDTFDKKYKKEVANIVQSKEWEQYMISNYSNEQLLELKELFYKGWDFEESKAKESILKLCWYLYHRNEEEKIMPKLMEFINSESNDEKFLNFCNKIALELEIEEKLFEENNLNSRKSEVYIFRNALNKEKQKGIKINPQYLMSNGFINVYYGINNYVSCLYKIIFNISHKELVNIMEEAHSPKAMQLLLEEMICNSDLDFEVYNRLLKSDIEWVMEWACHYFNTIVISKIKGGEYINHQIYVNNENALYQYASCIETISYEKDRVKRSGRCDLEYLSRLTSELEYYVKEEANLISKEANFNKETLFKLLKGSNDRINCENYYLLSQAISNNDCKNIFLTKIIDLFYEKWCKNEQFYAHCDYHVTYYAAYAFLEYWNNDVETIFKELKINNKSLNIGTEPGKYDMNYEEWNKAIQKVLWQILFLKRYKEALDEKKMVCDENYNKIIEKITELSAIKKECERWYDSAGLLAEVFQ
jgi:hypothetical protein